MIILEKNHTEPYKNTLYLISLQINTIINMFKICTNCGELFWGDTCPKCNNIIVESPKYDKEHNAYKAVRYGYQYRKMAQKSIDDKNSIHMCLEDPSPILCFLANIVLSGITWDALKATAKKLYSVIKKHKKKEQIEDKRINEIITDETKLYEFYDFIKEYESGFIHIEEIEYRYIEEEMYADFFAVEVKKVGIENITKHYKEIHQTISKKIATISRRKPNIKN